MKEACVEFYLEDLVEEKQEEVIDILGDNFDYENDPIVEIDFTVYEGDEYGTIEPEEAIDNLFGGGRHRGWRQQRHNRYQN